MTKTKNGCCVWDFTVSCEKMDFDVLIDHMNRMGKKWVFQLEMGKQTEYYHYQCRISLKKKSREPCMSGVHPDAWRPTSKENQDNFHYVEKEETRVDGPWKWDDPVMTRQIKDFMKNKLYDWQEQVLINAQIYNEREINILYDECGNIGKSIFSEYMVFKGYAEALPPLRLMDDIFQWVYCRPKKPCYFIDMPRGMKKDKLGDFWAGIETIKNGVAYEKRYEARICYFDRPVIWVFTNTLPCFKMMTRDRWKIWSVCPTSKQMFPLEAEQSSCNSD